MKLWLASVSNYFYVSLRLTLRQWCGDALRGRTTGCEMREHLVVAEWERSGLWEAGRAAVPRGDIQHMGLGLAQTPRSQVQLELSTAFQPSGYIQLKHVRPSPWRHLERIARAVLELKWVAPYRTFTRMSGLVGSTQ